MDQPTRGQMTLNIPGIVAEARARGRTAEFLVQSFENMPIAVAQDLLDGKVEITNKGRLVALRPASRAG